MRTSTFYNVYDCKEKKFILKNVDRKAVISKLGIPYPKVSEYAISGYRYEKRYLITKGTDIPDDLWNDFIKTLQYVNNHARKGQLRNVRFVIKRERRAS